MSERDAESIEPHGLRRVLLLVAVLAALWALGVATGFHEFITVDSIQRWAGEAGPVGVALFVGAFVVGQLAQVPGHAFIAAAVLVWGWWLGAFASLAGAFLGALASFWFARKVGGDVRRVRRPLLQRILAKIDAAPIATVVVARVMFMTAPPLAPALALSGLRHREHAVGSLIGLTPSVFFSAYAWGVGLDWFGL